MMVTLFTSPSCTSCRKAKAWLEEHEIAYKERNIFSEPLSISEIKEILRMTEDGTDEIISTRSKIFPKAKCGSRKSSTTTALRINTRASWLTSSDQLY